MTAPSVGRPVPRKEGPDKVSGATRYLADLTRPGMLHAATVRSPVARGRIGAIRFGEGIPWSEIVVVRAADIPGRNLQALIVEDQPCLAEDVVRHPEEPIVLLAHRDRHLLERARRAVEVDVEPLPPVLSIEEAEAAEVVIAGTDNVFKRYRVEKGDVEPAFADDGLVVVSGEYRTGAQEQLYIEPQGVLAEVDGDGTVVVHGSFQCPFYVRKALVVVLGLPAERVRVVACPTGGGFGGKEEYPSVLACHAALLAVAAGRPVRLVYDRAEDMVASTKRHPSRTRLRTATTPDGRLVALDIDFVLDGGAYETLSSVVLSRGTIHAGGCYDCPNVRVAARAVATNAPPHGAFRGFGAPQSIFALERHLDRAAAAVGLAPDELRRRNFLVRGRTTATGQVIDEPIDLAGLMDRALADADYRAKKERFAAENDSSTLRRGVGFASFFHGAGFTGSGEVFLDSVVGVEATEAGGVRILSASTEMGQGAFTVFSQIAADALGVSYDAVELAEPDTARVPDSGPTVASRTCMIVGGLVARACRSMRQALVEAGSIGTDATPPEVEEAIRRHLAEEGPLAFEARYEPPPGIRWDDELYRGDAYGAYAWATYVATVEVDLVTYEVRVTDFVARQEVGRVIHPVLAAGQIEGGVAQGIGLALYEQVRWADGRMANASMTNYIMPTAVDVPDIRVSFEEIPYEHGAFGSKGIGELPMDGAAPAVANAIADALGVAVDHVPFLPEDVMAAVEGS